MNEPTAQPPNHPSGQPTNQIIRVGVAININIQSNIFVIKLFFWLIINIIKLAKLTKSKLAKAQTSM